MDFLGGSQQWLHAGWLRAPSGASPGLPGCGDPQYHQRGRAASTRSVQGWGCALLLPQPLPVEEIFFFPLFPCSVAALMLVLPGEEKMKRGVSRARSDPAGTESRGTAGLFEPGSDARIEGRNSSSGRVGELEGLVQGGFVPRGVNAAPSAPVSRGVMRASRLGSESSGEESVDIFKRGLEELKTVRKKR